MTNGATSLKRKRRSAAPMQAYDQLPAELRAWLAYAALPWGPISARRAYNKAVARTQDTAAALRELDRLQERLIARDASRIWGDGYPVAAGGVQH